MLLNNGSSNQRIVEKENQCLTKIREESQVYIETNVKTNGVYKQMG